jgi:pullulanase
VNPVEESPTDGVWRFEGPADWDRMFYRFDIQVYHRQTNTVERYEVTDPYAVSLSTDSEFSQFVNLAEDPELKPDGWDSLVKELPFPTDITLYEAHMRDFSIIDQTVPESHRGTYMAFTHNSENGRSLSDGMNHLKELADAGLTHLHLLPVNDIASIIEDRSERVDLDDPYRLLCDRLGIGELAEYCERYGNRSIRDVFEEMAEEDPVTLEIQNTLAARYPDHPARYDGFNWGYDPFHFNVPEGSYATNPDGPQRILEFREMVQALNDIGLKLVIDVVYNHTHATGLSTYSVLDKIVPDYFQRLNIDTGEVETSTCCSNTAAEFLMMEKLIIDSVLLWAEHYKVDSFRFDLMGHHPRYVMENLQQALNELTVEEHGVDGKSIYIYGEGWNFGEVADNRIFDQATQFMTGGMGIGHFNDRIRDAVKGGFYSWTGRDQGFATGKYLFPNEESNASEEEKAALLDQADRIRVGMAGNLSTYRYVNRFGETVDGGNEGIGYTLMPQETVNYLDKHDNETLWDNTQAKLPFGMTMDKRVRVHLLSNAFINYGQGIPFYQLGTDLLRSKSMDRDSYDSGDWYNAIDYTLETTRWGKGLPPQWRNEDSWDALRTIMQNENVNITSDHMRFTRDVFLDQMRVRYSSPLIRLQSAEEIHKRVAFHNTGPDQDPGLIVMTISDGVCAGESLDPNYDGILVLFNAAPEPKTLDLGLSGMELHPLLENGSDPVLKETIILGSEIQIPALSGVVLVKTESGRQGDFVCNGVN